MGRPKEQGGLNLFGTDFFGGPIFWGQCFGTYFLGPNSWDLFWDQFLGPSLGQIFGNQFSVINFQGPIFRDQFSGTNFRGPIFMDQFSGTNFQGPIFGENPWEICILASQVYESE